MTSGLGSGFLFSNPRRDKAASDRNGNPPPPPLCPDFRCASASSPNRVPAVPGKIGIRGIVLFNLRLSDFILPKSLSRKEFLVFMIFKRLETPFFVSMSFVSITFICSEDRSTDSLEESIGIKSLIGLNSAIIHS